MKVRIGCCGFPVAKSNYYKAFSVVELQSTFYQLPQPDTARRWRTEAPLHFEFCLKAWQVITHPPSSPTYRRMSQRLRQWAGNKAGFFQAVPVVQEAWQRTALIARSLQARIILFQCPPMFQENDSHLTNLYRFFQEVNTNEFLCVIEFRAPWNPATIQQLCTDLHLIHGVDPFKEDPVCGDVVYLRLHGSPPGKQPYCYQYRDADLQRLLHKIRHYQTTASQVYCLFNNLSMWDDAHRFQQLLRSSSGR